MTRNLWKDQWDAVAIAAIVLLVFSYAFGGASQGHALRLAVVELASLPLLVMAAGRLLQAGLFREHRFAVALTAAIVAVPLIQLIPLPAAVWTGLPGRAEMLIALQVAGVQPGWAPLSMNPDRTWGSALALAPPIAMFLGGLCLSHIQRVRLIYFCLAAAVAGVFLGAAQLVSGGHFYLWAWAEEVQVRGIFANRNHFASSLLAALPFAITFGAAALRKQRRGGAAALWLGPLFAGLVIVALAAIRSRAGITLFAPVVLLSIFAAWIAAGRGRPGPGLLLFVGSIGAAITVVAVLALPPILARFDTGGAPEGRFERWPLVAETAQTYLPLGAGIGSFDAVYRSVEPLEQLDDTFFNQAHNDFLETWLEAGWLGISVVIAFIVWFFRRSASAWRAPPSRESDIQRAASIAVGVLLAHSLADYPLRTVTLTVIFALCCALLELAGRPAQAPTDPGRGAR